MVLDLGVRDGTFCIKLVLLNCKHLNYFLPLPEKKKSPLTEAWGIPSHSPGTPQHYRAFVTSITILSPSPEPLALLVE